MTKSMSKTKLAILALIIANIIWGAASPLLKWSMEVVHPFTLGFARFIIPALIVTLFSPKSLKIRIKDLPLFFAAGFFGSALNIGAFLLGIHQTASINSPIISSSGPIFLLLASILFLKEHPTRKMLLGNLLGLTGVLLIVVEPLIRNEHVASFTGNLLLILATFGSIIGTIFAKKLARTYHAFTITFWTFGIGSLFFIPSMLHEINIYGLLPQFQGQGLFGVVYGAIFSSFIAYSLFFWSLKYLFASQTSVFTYMDPIVAMLIAAPLLGEYPNLFFIAGSFLVFFGIFVAEKRIPYHPIHLFFKKH
jgi:O-acetylserine/cysteine efflux transporter